MPVGCQLGARKVTVEVGEPTNEAVTGLRVGLEMKILPPSTYLPDLRSTKLERDWAMDVRIATIDEAG